MTAFMATRGPILCSVAPAMIWSPGGTGNDRVNVWNNEGTDTIFGGESAGDVDELWFDATSGGVQVTYTGDESGTYTYDTGGSGSFDQIEFVWASDGNDVLDASASTGGVNAAGWVAMTD